MPTSNFGGIIIEPRATDAVFLSIGGGLVFENMLVDRDYGICAFWDFLKNKGESLYILILIIRTLEFYAFKSAKSVKTGQIINLNKFRIKKLKF